MDREKRQSQLVKRLRIEGGGGAGPRFITIDGIALGKLSRGRETGHWWLEWRAGWYPHRVEVEARDAEHAEGWAVDEIAALLASEEQARQEEQPGES
jgi:hypothetical protein